jgi:hypothetical protein
VVSAIGVMVSGKIGWPLAEWIGSGLLLGFVFVVWQTWAQYRKHTYDPELMLYYQKTWDEAASKRQSATKMFLAHLQTRGSGNVDPGDFRYVKPTLQPIDDVLDILDDIGFYMTGDQISPEVAHQHFYYWIRGYWCATRTYIEDCRREEPAQWRHLAILFEETTKIEGSIVGRDPRQLTLSTSAIKTFLQEESR